MAAARSLVGWRGVAYKVALDQMLLMPPLTVAFFMGMGMMEAKTMAESYARLETCFVPCVGAAVLFWVPTHIITFSSVPVAWRITWVSTAAVSWTVFMSYMNASEQRRELEEASG
eukprot:CAMPEP_0205930818 /NCGR_PEP_ID=MMETSP1325-20131115/26150_1 /ASSEMBLY_ACC=CAM_ASM_000708 /TAXON_ID=236786 /ORGANISM="Florenciella sp., Strain RCC1007" /LENGTH=114 /DNA_ID=CAMNT_0053300265 /DNA_START=12 /DNA_END=352 /DNA_ORIENTATION=+